MGSDAVSICNLALANIGHQPFIASLTEQSRAALLCNQLYAPARAALLRQYLWKFARKRVVLPALVNTPAFDGGNYYQLPTDCLRVVGTDDTTRIGYGRWFVEGNTILSYDTTTFNLIYVAAVDESLDDPIFDEALGYKIAKKLAMPLAREVAMMQAMDQEYKKSIAQAAFVGATETDSDAFIAETFISQHF